MGGSPEKRTPDVSLTAEAKVERLHFERVPDTGTRFWGQDERETKSGTERENLPEESREGVVYRDVHIRLEIIARITGVEQGRLEKEEQKELEPANPKRTTDKPTKRSKK